MHLLSASRLNDFLGCSHRAALWLAGIKPEGEVDATLKLIRDKGFEHEAEVLARLEGLHPSHLLHPLLIWVDGDPGDVYLAALKLDEKQHVVGHQPAQRKDLHCEKVRPRQHRQVSPNECCPGGRLLARRCGRYAVTAQNITDRLIRDLMPQIG
jgi:hypothetical protein